ncbi:DoxX family protein [Nonomuraea sp. NPDC050383]|uniref:DoxX family protein n=1 Tax=Nonomuraea sp. NPDC050383 TaxID=3364362 RepID=UPI0037B5F501
MTTARTFLNIALWIIQVLLAAMLVNSAVQKLLGNEEFVAGFARLGFGAWFLYLVVVLELAGALAVLIPRLAGPAAWGLVLMMCGAVVAELAVMRGSVVPALNVLVMAALVAWGRHRGTVEVYRRIARR